MKICLSWNDKILEFRIQHLNTRSTRLTPLHKYIHMQAHMNMYTHTHTHNIFSFFPVQFHHKILLMVVKEKEKKKKKTERAKCVAVLAMQMGVSLPQAQSVFLTQSHVKIFQENCELETKVQPLLSSTCMPPKGKKSQIMRRKAITGFPMAAIGYSQCLHELITY